MTCHCFIRHAVTPDERAAAIKRLEYSRNVSDTNGIIIALSALGACPAKTMKEKEDENEQRNG
jgi:hypothetical protein